MVDSGLEARKQIDELREIRDTLKNSFYETNSKTGEIRANSKNIDAYNKAGERIFKILQTKPEKNLNFNAHASVTSGIFKMMNQEKMV